MLKRIISAFMVCLLLTGCGGELGKTTDKQVVVAMTSEFSHTLLYDRIQTTGRHEYDYDEYGRLVCDKWISNEETVFTQRYFWSRDGLECTEISFDHQGLIPWPCSRVKEVYNENGSTKEQTVYEFFRVSQRSIYNYDDAGNLIRLEAADGKGNMTILQEYRYDEYGKQIMTIDASDPGMERITEHTYDEKGNELGWYYRENGILTEYVETQYDSQGRKMFSARYDAGGEVKHFWEYTYSGDGRTVTTSYSGETSSIDYFDESGLLIRNENYDAEGNLTGVTTYIYQTIQVKQNP